MNRGIQKHQNLRNQHELKQNSGLITSVELQEKYKNYIEKCQMDEIMVKANDLEGKSLPYDPPRVTTVTTFNDDELELWTLEREKDFVENNTPYRHVACDRPIYDHLRPSIRRMQAKKYIEDFRKLKFELKDVETELIPLAKGVGDEIDIILRGLEDMDISKCAVYCSQYFMNGNYFSDLRRKVFRISRSHIDEIMLIGLQSPRYLSKMPPEVTYASGQRWRRHIESTQTPEKKHFLEFERRVEKALSESQQTLNRFGDN